MPVNRTMAELYKTIAEERSAFHLRFGRAPVEGDPIIFDRSAKGPNPKPLLGRALHEHMTELTNHVGISPPALYALHRLHRLPPRERSFHAQQDGVLEYLDVALITAMCEKRGLATGR